MIKTTLAAAAMLLATAASAELMAPSAPIVVRGTITAVDATGALSVKANDGTALTVVLAPDTRVAALTRIGLDDIKANSFIGTAAKPGKNGVLEATEVHVFPESMRGRGEGHRPWDQGPTSTMTNGNVGKVGTIRHHKGRTLTVDYKGGTQSVLVPDNVPVVAFADGSAAQLVPGAHIFAFALRTPEGKLATNQVAVGLKGVVPPM